MLKSQALRPRMLVSLLMLVIFPGRPVVFATSPNSFTEDVGAEPIQPARAPVLLTVVLTNTGNRPLSYRCGFAGPYPHSNAREESVAQITDEQGEVREAAISNWQCQFGSVVTLDLDPGQSISVPAALDPLPVGSYTIQVGNGNSAHVTVKDDPQLAWRREQYILRRIREGDLFARHVAARYPSKSVVDGLLQDLLSEDRPFALHAALALAQVREMPSDSATLLGKAMEKQLGLEEKRRDGRTGVLLGNLAHLAAKVGSEEALAAVLALAHSDMRSVTGQGVIEALGAFKQERATRELHGFLKDKDQRVRFAAARTLAGRDDPAAIDELLAVAARGESLRRGYAYEALAKFPNDPRVEPAIEKGLRDNDLFDRGMAARALRVLRGDPAVPPKR